MVRRSLISSFIIFIAAFTIIGAQELTIPSKLTEVQQLRIENIKLQAQLIQLQQQTLQSQIKQVVDKFNLDKKAVEDDLRKTLNAKDTDIFNWETLKFESPNKKSGGG